MHVVYFVLGNSQVAMCLLLEASFVMSYSGSRVRRLLAHLQHLLANFHELCA